MKKGTCFVLLILIMLLPGCDLATVEDQSKDDVTVGANNDEAMDFAVRAQALLGGYDVNSLRKVTTSTIHRDLDAFLNCKPGVSGDGLEIYYYVPTVKQRGSEYGQVWYKFKTPAAIDDVLEIDKSNSAEKHDKILEFAFSEARKRVPDAAAKVDELGYTFTFAHQNLIGGFWWAPSKITIELRGDREVYIKTPTLVSSKSIPAIGGMSYCKVFTPSDAAHILVDLADKNIDRIQFKKPSKAPLDLAGGNTHSITKVSWEGLFGLFSQKGYIVTEKNYEASGNFKGTYVISPGGYIPALSMRGLAKEIASRGYVVIIIRYPMNVAFWEVLDFREESPARIAEIIKDGKLNKIRNLPSVVENFYQSQSSPIIALGHSLGGAALGSVIFSNDNPFDNIILYGVTSFIKMPWVHKVKADNVALFIGVEELKPMDKINKALNELEINLQPGNDGIYRSDNNNRTFQFIDGLSHFCIISDLQVGSESRREKDGLGPAPSEAVRIFVDHLVGRGML